MRALFTLWLCLAGCVANPGPRPGAADAGQEEPAPTTQYPGYCVARTEIDGDGAPDGERVAFYEDDRLVRDEFDSDLDGDADVLTSYAYDARGRQVREEIDRYADGELDEIRHFQWDDEDRFAVESWDEGADGTVDLVITYTHDELGRRVRGSGQRDEDEDAEMTLRFEWGSSGLLDALYVDGYYELLADGSWDRIIFYAYDEAGNLSVAGYDLDANGFTDLFVSFFYDCWM